MVSQYQICQILGVNLLWGQVVNLTGFSNVPKKKSLTLKSAERYIRIFFIPYV
jgi:hypothetical protein